MPYKDKAEQAAAAAKHYQANKEKMKARARRSNEERKERNTRYLVDYLLSHPCVDCGEGDPLVLAFDHQSDKLGNVADLLRNVVSIETLQREIDKCEVRCHNCHARRTAKVQGWVKYLILNDLGVEQSGSSPAS